MNENDKINDLYMKLLFKEYKKVFAVGDKDTLKMHRENFKNWIVSIQKYKELYAKYVLELSKESELLGELGKGKYNSVIPNILSFGKNGIAITRYASTFNNSKLAVNGELISYFGTPIIKYDNPFDQINYPNINPNFNTDITTLITELPYDKVDINALINSSRLINSVIIGSYGNLKDNNLKSKIYLLRKIKESIISINEIECKEEYITEGEQYSHIIITKQTLNKSLR